MTDIKTIRNLVAVGVYEFDPSRFVTAGETLTEWIESGDLADDVVEDFELARDALEALYRTIMKQVASD